MTPHEFATIRHTLGHRWGCGRALPKADLGRLLGFTGRDPGRMIPGYEDGYANIPPRVAVTMRLYHAGAEPPDWRLIWCFRKDKDGRSATTPKGERRDHVETLTATVVGA